MALTEEEEARLQELRQKEAILEGKTPSEPTYERFTDNKNQ